MAVAWSRSIPPPRANAVVHVHRRADQPARIHIRRQGSIAAVAEQATHGAGLVIVVNVKPACLGCIRTQRAMSALLREQAFVLSVRDTQRLRAGRFTLGQRRSLPIH